MAGSIPAVAIDDAFDFNTIKATVTAYVDNDNDTITVASNKLYIEGVVNISYKSLTLQRGYADCSEANANITDLT